MPVSETLAAISAAMQAFDLWAKYGGTQESVITQLNLKYDPEQFRQVELEIREQQPQNYEFWVEVFDGIDGLVKQCQKRFLRGDQGQHLTASGERRPCGSVEGMRVQGAPFGKSRGPRQANASWIDGLLELLPM